MIKTFKIFESYKKEDIVDALSKSEEWEMIEPTDFDHWSYQFEFKIYKDLFISVLGIRSTNSEWSSYTLNLYMKYNGEYDYICGCEYIDAYYVRNVGAITKYFNSRTTKDTLHMIEAIGEYQSEFYKDREKLPTDDELVMLFDYLSDMGYLLHDDIKYGYIKLIKDNVVDLYECNPPVYHKNNSSRPKIVLYYSRKENAECVEDEYESLVDEVKSIESKIKIYGYKVKCNVYKTSSRYFNGEHRPENFVITIESTE